MGDIMDNRVKDGSYINIQSFMVKDLKLSGNELITYALIFGFCQDGESRFQGSLQYIADWTASTKRGVQKVLARLCEKNLILKHQKTINNVVFNEYDINWEMLYASKFTGMEQSSTPHEQSSPNNIINNIDKEKSIVNNTQKEKSISNDCLEILNYLNEKAGTRFRSGENNIKFIKARLKEYSVDDLKRVIDIKVKEWKGTNMQQYLRPETLFNATKFESYINGLETKKETSRVVRDYDEREYTNEQFDSMITNIDELVIDDI